jgi:hypothetical protein
MIEFRILDNDIHHRTVRRIYTAGRGLNNAEKLASTGYSPRVGDADLPKITSPIL